MKNSENKNDAGVVEKMYQDCITSLERAIQETVTAILRPTMPDVAEEEKTFAEQKAHEEALRVNEELEKDEELKRLKKRVEQLEMNSNKE